MKLECSILLVPCFLPQLYNFEFFYRGFRQILPPENATLYLTPLQTCFSTCP